MEEEDFKKSLDYILPSFFINFLQTQIFNLKATIQKIYQGDLKETNAEYPEQLGLLKEMEQRLTFQLAGNQSEVGLQYNLLTEEDRDQGINENTITHSMVQLFAKAFINDNYLQNFVEYLVEERKTLQCFYDKYLFASQVKSEEEFKASKTAVRFQVFSLIVRLRIVFILLIQVKQNDDQGESSASKIYQQVIESSNQRNIKLEHVFTYIFNSFKHTFQGLKVIIEKLHANEGEIILKAINDLLGVISKKNKVGDFEKQITNLIQNFQDADLQSQTSNDDNKYLYNDRHRILSLVKQEIGKEDQLLRIDPKNQAVNTFVLKSQKVDRSTSSRRSVSNPERRKLSGYTSQNVSSFKMHRPLGAISEDEEISKNQYSKFKNGTGNKDQKLKRNVELVRTRSQTTKNIAYNERGEEELKIQDRIDEGPIMKGSYQLKISQDQIMDMELSEVPNDMLDQSQSDILKKMHLEQLQRIPTVFRKIGEKNLSESLEEIEDIKSDFTSPKKINEKQI